MGKFKLDPLTLPVNMMVRIIMGKFLNWDVKRETPLLTLKKSNKAKKQSCILLQPYCWRRPHGKGAGFEAEKMKKKSKNQISNFVFMSYGHYWHFLVQVMVSLYANWLQVATYDVSIQELSHDVPHYNQSYICQVL